MRLLAVMVLSVGLASTALCGEGKVAVPDAAALKDAEKTIKDIFKDEYAKRGVDDKKALAAKLLQQGTETRDDAVSRYVLLKEAVALAAASGDAETAAKAADALGEAYEVDAAALKAEALAKIVPATADAAKALTRIYLKAIDEAVTADTYDGAVKLCALAEAAARKTQDMPLASQVVARAKEVRALQTEFDKAKAAQATLKDKPDDPDANLVVGKFLCFTKGEWEKGLPLLAKGRDEKLKELAAKEIAVPSNEKELIAIADGWWDFGDKQTVAKSKILVHAGVLYEKAIVTHTGLERLRIEKRLQAIYELGGRVDLLKTIDVKRNFVAGNFVMRDGILVTSKGPCDRIQIPLKAFRSPNFELTCVVENRDSTHSRKENGLWIGFPFAGKTISIIIGSKTSYGLLSGIEMLDGKRYWENSMVKEGVQLPVNETRRLVIQVNGNRITALNDGVKVIDWEGKPERLQEYELMKITDPHAVMIGTWWTEYLIKELTITAK